MNTKEHCERCEDILGELFEYVHAWLDEFADGTYNHREFRHHEEGIEEVRKMWGTKAAIAARLHIEQDWGTVPKKHEYSNMFKLRLAYYRRRGYYVPKNL